MLRPLLPWVAALIGLGIGVAIIGGDSPWLFAFAGVPWALVMVAILP